MRISISAAAGYFLLATCLDSLAAEPDAKPTGPEAQAAAARWLDNLGEKGLLLNQMTKEGDGFVVAHAPSAVGRITKFSFQQDGYWVSLAFKGELSPDTTKETLQDRFWYVALDRLPTPGLDLPGWEVRPQTPTSSVREGVEVLEYGDGRLKIRVRTGFFALYGRDPSVLVPADAPSPPGSYFQIRRRFQLDLTLDAPVKFQ